MGASILMRTGFSNLSVKSEDFYPKAKTTPPQIQAGLVATQSQLLHCSLSISSAETCGNKARCLDAVRGPFHLLCFYYVCVNQRLHKLNFTVCSHVIWGKRGDKLVTAGKMMVVRMISGVVVRKLWRYKDLSPIEFSWLGHTCTHTKILINFLPTDSSLI